MPAVFCRRKRQLLIAFFVALSCTAAWRPAAQAQEHDEHGINSSAPLYALTGADGWINSKPLSPKQLKGKVVLVDFWAYSCINCLRSMPYIEAWAQKYGDSGLVVIGVHTPEFGFGQKMDNVQNAVKKFSITFPIALDSDYVIWKAFQNQYWPADYFIDAHGKIRFEHFAEGDYAQSEQWIQQLLKERSATSVPSGTVSVQPHGIEAAADFREVHSPETYIGYARAANFASPGGIDKDADHLYSAPVNPAANQWGLDGKWVDHQQVAVLKSATGKITFHFYARDLHLVLGPASHGKAVHFRVTIDGKPPGNDHGVDTDEQGNGVVTEYRLYQLIRQRGAVTDHIFTIEFQDPGVQAFSFTFG